MKRLMFLGLAAAVSLLAQGPGPRPGFGPGGPGGPGGRMMGPGGPGGPGMQRTVTGAPFSGVEVTTTQQMLANGNSIQKQTKTPTYRDSQGRTRMEVSVTRPAANSTTATSATATHTDITIHDPVAGVMRHVNVENRTVVEQPVHGRGGPGGARGPNPNAQPRNNNQPRVAGQRPGRGQQAADPNTTTQELGTQTINGVVATGTRITHTIPAGTIGNAQAIQSVREVWTATDLKIPVRTIHSDPRFGTTVTEMTNIVRAEPDASLFQSPAGFTVQKGAQGRGPQR